MDEQLQRVAEFRGIPYYMVCRNKECECKKVLHPENELLFYIQIIAFFVMITGLFLYLDVESGKQVSIEDLEGFAILLVFFLIGSVIYFLTKDRSGEPGKRPSSYYYTRMEVLETPDGKAMLRFKRPDFRFGETLELKERQHSLLFHRMAEAKIELRECSGYVLVSAYKLGYLPKGGRTYKLVAHVALEKEEAERFLDILKKLEKDVEIEDLRSESGEAQA